MRMDTVVGIAKRAEQMKISAFDRLTLIMDLECANKEFGLKLKELLAADDLNFAHDICGIQRHINRETGRIENYFVPRFAVNAYIKEDFEEMIRDWRADHTPEYDDLKVHAAKINGDTGKWEAIAEDDKAVYSLTDWQGNIIINYVASK